MKIKESAKIGDDKAKIKEECKECTNTSLFSLNYFSQGNAPLCGQCVYKVMPC